MSNNLNINTANIGYAASGNNMMLKQAVLYLDFHDGNGLLPVGYTDSEVTTKMSQQFAEFKTDIPKTLVRRDIIDQDLTVEIRLKQFQKELVALALQRRVDESDTNYDRVIIGTSVPAPVFPSAVLKGRDVSDRSVDLYIRKFQVSTEDWEVVLGGDDYAGYMLSGRAVKDDAPLTTNPTWPYNPALASQDNIAFWAFPKDTSSGS